MLLAPAPPLFENIGSRARKATEAREDTEAARKPHEAKKPPKPKKIRKLQKSFRIEAVNKKENETGYPRM